MKAKVDSTKTRNKTYSSTFSLKILKTFFGYPNKDKNSGHCFKNFLKSLYNKILTNKNIKLQRKPRSEQHRTKVESYQRDLTYPTTEKINTTQFKCLAYKQNKNPNTKNFLKKQKPRKNNKKIHSKSSQKIRTVSNTKQKRRSMPYKPAKLKMQ